MAPLGNRRHRVEFTASDALVGKLERAQALMSHKLPGSDIADVIEEALTELVERLEKARFGVRGSGNPRGQTKSTPEPKRRAKLAATGAGAGDARLSTRAGRVGGRRPPIRHWRWSSGCSPTSVLALEPVEWSIAVHARVPDLVECLER